MSVESVSANTNSNFKPLLINIKKTPIQLTKHFYTGANFFKSKKNQSSSSTILKNNPADYMTRTNKSFKMPEINLNESKNFFYPKKTKHYKNKSEILLLNRRPSISYVRSILSPDDIEGKKNSYINFYKNENYEFNINESDINKYRKRERVKSDFKLRDKEIERLIKNKIDTKVEVEQMNDVKGESINNFNHNYTLYQKQNKSGIITGIQEKESYYNKLKDYSNSNKRVSLSAYVKYRVDDLNVYSGIVDSLKAKKPTLKSRSPNHTYKTSIATKNTNVKPLSEPVNETQSDSQSPSPPPNNINLYQKEILYKEYIIDKFINDHKEADFVSNMPKHRRIFVILDGTQILNHNLIQGKFVDIPTKRFFLNLKTRKERMEVFFKFINTCQQLFTQTKIKLRSIFLKNATPIFDLYNIPDSDRYLYISDASILKGVSVVFNKNKSKLLKNYACIYTGENEENKYKLIPLARKNIIKDGNKPTFKGHSFDYSPKSKPPKKSTSSSKFVRNIKMRNKKLNIKKVSSEVLIQKWKKIDKDKNNNDRRIKKYVPSFTEENHINISNSTCDWGYYSENEENKRLAQENIKVKSNNKFETYLYFNEIYLEKKKASIKNKIKGRRKSPKSQDLTDLIDNFNKHFSNKEKQLQKFMKKKNVQLNFNNNVQPLVASSVPEDPLIKQTKLFMRKFLENLELFKKEDTGSLEEIFIKYKVPDELKYVKLNRKKHENLYFNLDRELHKYYPSLIHFNFPKLLKLYKNLDRQELYEMYVQYKVLLKICAAMNRNFKIIQSGIDFATFWKGIPQMNNETEQLAKMFFTVMNERGSSYLSLEEFYKGMSVIHSKNISEKIDMFFKIIDSDGNGRLSFDEVYEISLMSLQRSVVSESENSKQVVKELAHYFATLIFELVDIDKEEEIPLERIKDKIIQGGEAGSYLEMFCCADGFRKPDKITFTNKKK